MYYSVSTARCVFAMSPSIRGKIIFTHVKASLATFLTYHRLKVAHQGDDQYNRDSPKRLAWFDFFRKPADGNSLRPLCLDNASERLDNASEQCEVGSGEFRETCKLLP